MRNKAKAKVSIEGAVRLIRAAARLRVYHAVACNAELSAHQARRYAAIVESVKQLCREEGIYAHVQTDPRGPALYLHTSPINESNYTEGECL